MPDPADHARPDPKDRPQNRTTPDDAQDDEMDEAKAAKALKQIQDVQDKLEPNG